MRTARADKRLECSRKQEEVEEWGRGWRRRWRWWRKEEVEEGVDVVKEWEEEVEENDPSCLNVSTGKAPSSASFMVFVKDLKVLIGSGDE